MVNPLNREELGPLRVLVLEDSPRDAELSVRELRRFGYEPEWTRAETEEEFRAQIRLVPDLILADFSLPQFDALAALRMLRDAALSIPFIIVSGAITEQTAVAALKLGADDYLLKDRLTRLGPAVKGALEQQRLRDEERRAQEALAESDARYRRLVTRMSALVVELDAHGNTLFVNDAVTKLTGHTPAQVVGRSWYKLFFDDATRAKLETAIGTLSQGEDIQSYVTPLRTANGSWISVEWNTANAYGADGLLKKIIAFGVDITERENVRRRILRLSRLYAVISKTNEALLRSRNSEEIFSSVCRACVEHGGFRLAWIGMADPDADRFTVVKAFGPAIEYLDGIAISPGGDQAIGRGPTGIAYREQRVYICNNFANDPATAPWQERATGFGIVASISLPFYQNGKVMGTLTVYGGEKEVFDEEGVALLERMAENISFALDQFEREAERCRLMEQRESDVQRLAELSRRVVSAQEEERRRLAAELHDDSSPNLTAALLNLDLITQDLPAQMPNVLHDRLADVRGLLADTIRGIRDVCAELRPATLDYVGLSEALREYAAQFARRTGIDVKVSIRKSKRRLGVDVESMLFRVAQEALTNSAKHAKASVINLELTQDQSRTVLTIEDNGAGFDVQGLGRSEHKPGLGLLSMRERAEFAGGRFSVQSKPGMGTRIKVEI